MKNNLTSKLAKTNFILLSIITLIFLSLNVLGYKPYSIKRDTLVPVLKSGDLVYVKDNKDLPEINLKDGRNIRHIFINKDIIRFPYLGYVKDYLDTNVGKAVVVVSIIFLVVTICRNRR